ncbi:MAG: DUF192 domain-containing protein [Candidatus Komeilibacteria bacterium]|jgi:uncharacterized protein|nr:DUF192 domain-containing protein [Candidatus Komeilibacteria bacterium]MBT4448004.1 DUF192 domain-containing protein [Candidatus Komeilibacteria bacterium]
MKKHKFKIVLFIVIIALVYAVYYNFFRYNEATVTINDYVFKTEVVQSEKDVTRGLSGREILADNQAMFFILPEKKIYRFWMKDMKFNIDLLWIDDNKIVGFEKNMQAFENITSANDLPAYSSPQAVDRVLEIKAGLIDSLDIKIGDIINISI